MENVRVEQGEGRGGGERESIHFAVGGGVAPPDIIEICYVHKHESLRGSLSSRLINRA